MNADKVIGLIRQHGLSGLSEPDGCPCCHFKLHGISVDVSCRKSEKSIRVHSQECYRSPHDLEDVAVSVAKSLYEETETLDYILRFCDYRMDHNKRKVGEKWIEEILCCYCERAREKKAEYLCNDCLAKPEAARLYPWRPHDAQ